jgi:nitrous oxidase accessory protein
MVKRFIYHGLITGFMLVWLVMSAQAQEETRLVVKPEGPYTTIEAALEAATENDTIEVHSGVYSGPLTVEKSVTLIGIDMPVIDGGGEGTVVIITADDVTMRGFTIRNSGQNNSHEDSGLVIQADRVTVEDNLLEDVLFGIYFADAADGIARNNIVRGYDLDLARRGDGIRVWFSSNVLLENNHVSITRDILIWFADDITIIDNTFKDARYGLHFMYSDNAWVENNHFTHNSVGTYLMYSTGLTVIGNDLSYNRGPSGYGIALKDMDAAVARDNWLIGNRVGLYLDNSPSLYEGFNEFTGNVFAYNDIGVAQLPSVERNLFSLNTFLDNTQQVSVRGRGTLQGNTWTVDGTGNYWSDYAGYDANGDMVGDMAYRSERLFETLTDSNASLRFFIYSPASQAIDLAAMAFPSLRPEVRLTDEAPLTRYRLPESTIIVASVENRGLLLPSVLLAAVGLLPLLTLLRSRQRSLIRQLQRVTS